MATTRDMSYHLIVVPAPGGTTPGPPRRRTRRGRTPGESACPATGLTTVAADRLDWPAGPAEITAGWTLNTPPVQDCHRTVTPPRPRQARQHAPSGRTRPAPTSSASSDSAARAPFRP